MGGGGVGYGLKVGKCQVNLFSGYVPEHMLVCVYVIRYVCCLHSWVHIICTYEGVSVCGCVCMGCCVFAHRCESMCVVV